MYDQLLNQHIRPGNEDESVNGENHQAEQLTKTMQIGRGGGQADQNAEQAEQVQAEPEFVAGLGGFFYQLNW